VQDAFRLYLQHHRAESHAASTVEWHEERLGRFYAFLQARGYPTDLNAVRAPHLRDFITYLQTECVRWKPCAPCWAILRWICPYTTPASPG
jgi:site-specific recombinase XerD